MYITGFKETITTSHGYPNKNKKVRKTEQTTENQNIGWQEVLIKFPIDALLYKQNEKQ